MRNEKRECRRGQASDLLDSWVTIGVAGRLVVTVAIISGAVAGLAYLSAILLGY